MPLPEWSRWLIGWFLVHAGAPRIRRRPCSQPHRVDRFTVFAFVNDESHWAELRTSLTAAGFEAPIRLSDQETEPYETISRLGAGEGYAILCHQDVRFDQGMGEAELRARVNELSRLDPCWTVAGNAGVTRHGCVVWGPQDRSGRPAADQCPAQVVSLDENFLILNCGHSPRCSQALSGFHFYGADVCLNAIAEGGTAYVIDSRMTHLSVLGSRDASYRAAEETFLDAWNHRFWFRYVGTTTETLFMSRFQLVRRIFGSARARALVSLLRERHAAT